MADKRYKTSTSLALQLNFRWLWRLFWIFIRLDVLILLMGIAGLISVGERETGQAWYISRDQPLIRLPDMEINRYPLENLAELPLPDILPFLYTDSPPVFKRTFSLMPPVQGEETPQRQQLHRIHYNRIVEEEGQIWVVSYSADAYIQNFMIFTVMLLMVEVLFLISNFFTGVRVARRVLSPIAELAQQTSGLRYERQGVGAGNLQALAGTISGIDADKLSTRIDVEHTQEELQELALAINTMLERIKEAYENQNQFVSDASHELKTPIAVIQGYANLLDRWGKNDENALQESIDAIKSEAERMKNLTNDLLFLARGDSVSVKKDIIDAKELLEEVCRESFMIDSRHRWQLKTTEERILLTGDIDLLKQALRVLVDNAGKYSPDGSDIVLGLKKQNGYAQLSVQDQGMGIPDRDLPQIFNRFFRSDPSRTRKTGGAGLGLAIAAWTIAQHDGYLEVISREGIGTRMSIFLKTAPDDANPS